LGIENLHEKRLFIEDSIAERQEIGLDGMTENFFTEKELHFHNLKTEKEEKELFGELGYTHNSFFDYEKDEEVNPKMGEDKFTDVYRRFKITYDFIAN